MGLDYCHRMGVVNRDIKLENTLLDSSHNPPLVKITDFGYCKSDKESLPKSKVGTPGYTGGCSRALWLQCGGSRGPEWERFSLHSAFCAVEPVGLIIFHQPHIDRTNVIADDSGVQRRK